MDLPGWTPFDALRIERGTLCGFDLGIYHGLANAGVVERLDKGDDVVDSRTVDDRGRACLSVPSHDRYTIYRLRIRRGKQLKPVMQIHLKGGPNARILGIVRIEP